MPADHSRALLLGQNVTDQPQSELAQRLEGANVSIAIDLGIPGAVLTASILVRTLRRLPGSISIDPDELPTSLVEQLRVEADAIDPDRPIAIGRPRAGDTIIRIGTTGPPGSLRVIPDLHGFRLSWASNSLRQGKPASALGSAAAAAAAAAEIFKVSAGVIGVRGRRHRRLAWCPVTLSHRPDQGPDLPRDWQFDGILLGLGAIGSATALILSEMPVGGSLDLVDPQRFAPENVGTYSLGGAKEGLDQPWKTSMAASALRRFETRSWNEVAAYLPELIDKGRLRWPRIVLTGLDSPDARRDSQRLWPDYLIDGATGDTMVGLHAITAGGRPCLACFFPPTATPTVLPTRALERATGLPTELLVRGAEILHEAHLEGLSVAHQERLRPFVGREICGLASALGLTELPDEGYRPSVAFVSLTAATLVVGRLVGIAAGWRPAFNFVQYDTLAGPRQPTRERRTARPACDCVQRAGVVAEVRHRRAAYRFVDLPPSIGHDRMTPASNEA